MFDWMKQLWMVNFLLSPCFSLQRLIACLLAFHDELDFVSVHDSILEEFRSVLISSRSRQSLESQIEAIVKSKGTDLVERTAFLHVSVRQLAFSRLKLSSSQIFKDLLRQLLQGKALSIEDTVDLLTLKDNAESLEDYTTSLQLLNYAKVSCTLCLIFGFFLMLMIC